MKHLQIFENFSDIDVICKKHGIRIHGNYTINSDGTIDVDGDVILSNKGLGIALGYGDGGLTNKGLTNLPVKFGKTTGDFICSYNQLKTLEGSPKEVGGSFFCSYNQLTTLEGGPKKVGMKREESSFYCDNNQLSSLLGCPSYVGGDFNCDNNKLTTLEGGPNEIGYDFYCSGNPISNVYNIFNDYKEYQDSLDYNYLRGTDIVKSRFEEALQEIGKTAPKSIKGYNYI